VMDRDQKIYEELKQKIRDWDREYHIQDAPTVSASRVGGQ